MAKVYLDPGHGGHDPGASGYGLREKDVVLKIARYTRDYLQSDYKGVTVRMSRNSDKFVSLSARARDANNWGADVFVSLHNNAFNGSANGYEDFIYNGNVSSDTLKLQDSIHNEISPLFSNNRGQKRANFAVVRQTNMPAVLTENGFIDHKGDNDYLKKDSNLKKIGEAHAKGIAVFLGLVKGSSKPASSSSSGSTSSNLYRVRSSWNNARSQAGAFSNLNNAKRLADQHSYNVYDSKGKRVYSGGSPTNEASGAIADIQRTLNSRYGLGISVDNIFGPETKRALIKGYQTELNKQFNAGLSVDGIWGLRTEGASVTVRRGARGNLTWILQAALRCKGYSISVDGIFGGGTEKTVRQFQKDAKISADGIPGPVTFRHLFS